MTPAPYSRIRLSAESAAERRQYVGLTADDLARLRDWRSIVASRTPAVLDDFYAFLGRQADTCCVHPRRATRHPVHIERAVCACQRHGIRCTSKTPYLSTYPQGRAEVARHLMHTTHGI